MKVSKPAGSSTLRIGDVFKKALPVTLTPWEVAEFALEMASAQVEVSGLEEEKKRVVKEFTDKIKPLKEKVALLAPVVESGVEERPVDVQWEQELGAGSAVLRRLDTQEVLEDSRRALEAHEMENLQHTLGFGGDAARQEEPVPVLEFKKPPSVPRGEDKPSRKVTILESEGPVDYRRAPVNANRGKELCATEEEHEYKPSDAEGWEACRKCPQDRRVVARIGLTDMGEKDMAKSEAALEQMEAVHGPSAPEVRWLIPAEEGATPWFLAISGDDLYLHSPDLSATPSQRHGPAVWVAEESGASRIQPRRGVEWDVPAVVLAKAAELIAQAPEGMPKLRSLEEQRAAIAAERAADVNAPEGESTGPDGSSPVLTEAAVGFLLALLDGPQTAEYIRSKTHNRRPGTTAKNLMQKGLVLEAIGTNSSLSYDFTPGGRALAERLKAEKASAGA